MVASGGGLLLVVAGLVAGGGVVMVATSCGCCSVEGVATPVDLLAAVPVACLFVWDKASVGGLDPCSPVKPDLPGLKELIIYVGVRCDDDSLGLCDASRLVFLLIAPT